MAEPMIHGVGECRDPETIAAYLDGRLSDRERDAMAAHLASCETCYFLFLEAAQTRPATAAVVTSPRWWTRPMVWPAAAAGLAVAATLVLAFRLGVMPWGTSEEPALQALVAAVGTERTIEPRLSGGFAYGPVRGPVRAGEPATDTLPPDVRIAAAQIEKDAIADRTPQRLQALGVAYLVMGDATRAVPVLEEAADHATADPRVLSDLSAAYLVRATREETPQDVVRALTMADRAVKADPRLLEGWFNRAYALERLTLIDQARQAWEDYLKIDSTSGWAGEARSHFAALGGQPQAGGPDDFGHALDAAVDRRDDVAARKLVASAPDAARIWLQQQLLNSWPRAILEGRSADVDAALARAQIVADIVTDTTGDRFMADAVNATMGASRDARRASVLARAHQDFRTASVSYQNDDIVSAMPIFARARLAMDNAESPFGIWAGLYLGIGRYYAADFSGALKNVQLVSELSDQRKYFRVAGLARRMSGLIDGVQGDFAGGLEQYRLATASFERARDVENEAAMRASIAEHLGFLGETDLAWSEISRGLSQLPWVRDRRSRHNILQRGSLSSLSDGFPESALYFQQAVLTNATLWERPLAVFDAHLYESEIYRQLGNLPEALSDLQRARDTLAAIKDPQLVARNQPRVQLAQAELELQSRSPAAVASFSTAFTAFDRAQRTWPMARVLLGRGRAHVTEGRIDLAEADFTAGIDLFERRRAAIADEALRTASFEQPWDLYSEMIRLQAIDRHRPDRALEFAERARARTLLESLANSDDATPADPSIARTTLPQSVTVLYYAALEDRMLTWVLTSQQQTFIETPVRDADVRHLLNQFKSEVAARPTTGRDTISLAKLYDLLIRPVRSQLEIGSHLIIVPDGALHSVPFAALIQSEDRRYLLEDHPLQIAPSLTVFLKATSKGASFSDASSAFVIGNPTIDGDDAGLMPSLPQAAAEAADVAALYKNPMLLIGAAATKAAFVRSAGRYEVIHFAGHAIANERYPQHSRLLLAGSDAATRSLFARDIASERFSTTQLVVLGACRTSGGRVRRGEGVFNLARPFLAAGVPAVVAALWDVDDRAGRRLLVAFHRALRKSGTAAEALRQAQLELMGDTNPMVQSPLAWAGFTLIGGLSYGTVGHEERSHDVLVGRTR